MGLGSCCGRSKSGTSHGCSPSRTSRRSRAGGRAWTTDTFREHVGDAFAIEHEGELAGYAEVWEELDPGYRHGGTDLFLGSAHQGRGVGGDAVTVLARHLVHDRGHHRLVIDPAAENERAIRCYARIGFRRIGVQRRYELAGDGTWRDGLLMDLLAEELG